MCTRHTPIIKLHPQQTLMIYSHSGSRILLSGHPCMGLSFKMAKVINIILFSAIIDIVAWAWLIIIELHSLILRPSDSLEMSTRLVYCNILLIARYICISGGRIGGEGGGDSIIMQGRRKVFMIGEALAM